MKGKRHFSTEQATRICSLLDERLRLDPPFPKGVRDKLRDLGFYISDWDAPGLTSTDFRRLVANGSIELT
jgi:hypothetical protein